VALIGRALLILALGVALYGVGASLYGARRGRREFVDSGRRAVYAVAGLATLAFAILEDAFYRSDFSFNVVAGHSSTTTPTFYKLAAAWSSQEGSLLLWVFLLSAWSSLILFLTRRRAREIVPYATAVLLAFDAFFTSLAVFFANPFATSAQPPAEGAGLDPLLLHPSMMIHPPMLYSGYTLLTIPFAFAVGALITGRLGAEWISLTRRFALAAWLFLGVGILLGARWSYTELGWGGYWAWDPVENAALMPWLCITAFIHSIMIQEKRGMLKVWNASLVLGAGTLSILGTFLVRSGILDSIHAFGASTLGIPFVVLIGVMVTGSIGLILWRREQLRSEAQLESLVSREAIFLFQNMVLVAMVAVIFWITFFPLISQALTGTKVSVGPPAFRPFIVPLALILVLLSGIGPVIAWRRVTVANLRRNFTLPALVGIVTLIVLTALPGGPSSRPFALIMFALAGFVLAGVAQELWRGTAARRAMTHDAVPLALVGLIRRNRRRYGGYIVHAGLAVMLVGVAASSSFQHSQDVYLSPGQKAGVDGYTIRYVRPVESISSQKIGFGAVLDVSKAGKHVTTVTTTRNFYPSQNVADGLIGRFFDTTDSDSQVGLDAGLRRDIWTVIDVDPTHLASLINQANNLFAAYAPQVMTKAAKQPPGQAQTAINTLWAERDVAVSEIARRFVTHPWASEFLLIVDPLVTWIWLGALIIFGGGLIALWPVPNLARRRAAADVPSAARPAPSGGRGQIPVREPA
jgi:cytochrome c-type biogenesis protein CcmF